MSGPTRRWVPLLALVRTCVLPTGSAQAQHSGDNVATAVIEQDEGRAFDFAWDVDRQKGDDPVLHRNSATARGRCTRCRATAIAFQIALVSGSPRTVVPQNTAEAVNVECTECTVVAEARQFVRVIPDPVRFTGEGRAVLADVREDLETLETQNLPIDQLHQAVETEEGRVLDVLRRELVLKSDPETEADVFKQRSLQAADVG